jgi:DNA mismatch endonuclease (patch repair protein)
MADRISRQHRSWNMSRIRDRDSKPEKVVRSTLHRLGYRFRLHRADLPGKPDIVLPKYRTVVFVHGCFWHRHPDCRFAYTPKSRVDFWNAKFTRNVERDLEVQEELHKLGWKIVIIWECQTKSIDNHLEVLESIRRKP